VSIQEQAKQFLAQGMLCRAAVLYKKLCEQNPTPENLAALAAVYMEQGLFEDAVAVEMRAMGIMPSPMGASVN
jgi:lipopolysaccharide biosynthesis regulator YciM